MRTLRKVEFRGMSIHVEEVMVETPDLADVTIHADGKLYRFRGIRRDDDRVDVFTVIDGGGDIPRRKKMVLRDFAGAILRDRMNKSVGGARS